MDLKSLEDTDQARRWYLYDVVCFPALPIRLLSYVSICDFSAYSIYIIESREMKE